MNKRITLCIITLVVLVTNACSVAYVANTSQQMLAKTHLIHHHTLTRQSEFSLSRNAHIYLYSQAYSERHHRREESISQPRLMMAREAGFVAAFREYFPHTTAGSASLSIEEARLEALAIGADFLLMPNVIYDSAEENKWQLRHSKKMNLVLLDPYTWKVHDSFAIGSEQIWLSPVRKDADFYAAAAQTVAAHLSPSNPR